MTDTTEDKAPMAIAWGDLVPLLTDDWEELPDAEVPYYIQAKNGTYLHRHTVMGRGIIRTWKTPPRLKPVEQWNGFFRFKAEELPATIYAQAVSFFRWAWNTHKTEAEVIILKNIDTGLYSLFAPSQRVSHGGVHSIYNPAALDRRELVVGTFHSHCNFSPYHSGTDEGDAREMDGLHGTIGFVDKDVPEMALMFALAGQLFHFKAPFDGIVNMNDLNAAAHDPAWEKTLILGTVTDDMREAIAPYANDETWDKFMGRWKRPVTQPQANTNWQSSGYQPHTTPTPVNDWSRGPWGWDDYAWNPRTRTYEYIGAENLSESKDFNKSKAKDTNKDFTEFDPDDIADYMEDMLEPGFIDSILAINVLTEEDIEVAIEKFPKSADEAWWERKMRVKLARISTWLNEHGYDVTYALKKKEPPIVPGQTSFEDAGVSLPA